MSKTLLVAAALSGLMATSTFTTPQQPPAPILMINPEYPQELVKEKVEGVCDLRYDILQGTVANIEIVSCTNPGFGAPAEDALVQWRFAQTVSVQRELIRFEFKLE